MANFNKDYVKTSVFPREMGRKIGQAEEIRHASDYDDFYIATREEAEEVAIELSVEIAAKLYDIADGFYFMTPFNRTGLIARIIEAIRQEEERR